MDYQNAYRRARTCFGLTAAPPSAGQFRPEALGRLLAASGPGPRALTAVRVYRGEPSPTRDPRGHSAAQRQVASWRRDPLVTVVTRPYQYLPGGLVREKGIDVLIALDLVEGAWRGAFDVAVVVSADSDLAPAVERVIAAGTACEVAAWRSPACRSRLAVRGGAVRCHWLERVQYDAVADRQDWTRRPGT